MKVQLQMQRLRLRIDEAELRVLQAGDILENLTVLAEGVGFRQQLCVRSTDAPVLVALADGFRLELPAMAVAEYIARLPCREGLVFGMPAAAAGDIEIHFEVDVRDSVRSRGVPRR